MAWAGIGLSVTAYGAGIEGPSPGSYIGDARPVGLVFVEINTNGQANKLIVWTIAPNGGAAGRSFDEVRVSSGNPSTVYALEGEVPFRKVRRALALVRTRSSSMELELLPAAAPLAPVALTPGSAWEFNSLRLDWIESVRQGDLKQLQQLRDEQALKAHINWLKPERFDEALAESRNRSQELAGSYRLIREIYGTLRRAIDDTSPTCKRMHEVTQPLLNRLIVMWVSSFGFDQPRTAFVSDDFLTRTPALIEAASGLERARQARRTGPAPTDGEAQATVSDGLSIPARELLRHVKAVKADIENLEAKDRSVRQQADELRRQALVEFLETLKRHGCQPRPEP